MELILAIENGSSKLIRRKSNNSTIDTVKRVIIENDYILRSTALLSKKHQRTLSARLSDCSLNNKKRDVIQKFCQDIFD